MNNNSAKSLHEIVSVDAWHAQFDSEKRASVHVDLSFSTGEMGSEEASQVTFKLSIKKATLKIVIPATEGVAVIQSSVDREPTLEGVRKVIEESRELSPCVRIIPYNYVYRAWAYKNLVERFRRLSKR